MKLVTNSAEHTFYDVWRSLADQADDLRVISPFFTFHKPLLECVRRGTHIRVVTTLEFPTHPASLQAILAEMEVSYHPEKLHSKIYLFNRNDEPFAALIGSSNITQAGFTTNLEANIWITEPAVLAEVKAEVELIYQESIVLEPIDIDRYRRHYLALKDDYKELERAQEKFKALRKVKTTPIHLKVSKDAKEYQQFWTFADQVCALVGDHSENVWPQVPVYLAVDHFWHWIKTEWEGFTEDASGRDHAWRAIHIPQLYQRYIDWVELSDSQYTRTLPQKASYFANLLTGDLSHLLEQDFQNIYRSMHCGANRAQRFKAHQKFSQENDLKKIRAALHYLLFSEDPIMIRINALLKDPKFRLKQFGRSGIQELIGWVHYQKMPIRNTKADEAVTSLGFIFST